MHQNSEKTVIAYVINVYPSPSHTFIRREIRALERDGASVIRLTIRRFRGQLADTQDVAELAQTQHILAWGGLSLLPPLVRVLAVHPLRLARAIKTSLRFRGGGMKSILRHLAYTLEACAVAERVVRARAQHVHAHFGSNSAMVALLCQHLTGTKFSMTIHGPEEFEDPLGHRLTEKINAAAFVVGVSADGVRQLRQFADRPDKIKLVRCGVDDDFLNSPLTPPPPEPRIVFVGRFHERKNPATVQKAALSLHQRQIPLRVTYIGDGPLFDAQRQSSERAGLLGGIERYLGWADAATIRHEILNSRALVLPSRAEGLPVVLMEALALGRPVIASDVGGTSELVQHGVNGWLIPPGDADALAAAIEEAVTCSTEPLAEMGERGRRRVMELHDAQKNARQLLELFRAQIAQ